MNTLDTYISKQEAIEPEEEKTVWLPTKFSEFKSELMKNPKSMAVMGGIGLGLLWLLLPKLRGLAVIAAVALIIWYTNKNKEA